MGSKRRFHNGETSTRNWACRVREVDSSPKRNAAWPGSPSSPLTTPAPAMEAFMRLAEVVYFDNGLNPVQSELAYYTSAVVNSCFY